MLKEPVETVRRDAGAALCAPEFSLPHIVQSKDIRIALYIIILDLKREVFPYLSAVGMDNGLSLATDMPHFLPKNPKILGI